MWLIVALLAITVFWIVMIATGRREDYPDISETDGEYRRSDWGAKVDKIWLFIVTPLALLGLAVYAYFDRGFP